MMKEEKVASDGKPIDPIAIMGYKVVFPKGKKPFPSQLAVMSKALAALRQGKNALLESPTGTGKTLALLCSTLAWQKEQKRINTEAKQEKFIKSLDCDRKVGAESDGKQEQDENINHKNYEDEVIQGKGQDFKTEDDKNINRCNEEEEDDNNENNKNLAAKTEHTIEDNSDDDFIDSWSKIQRFSDIDTTATNGNSIDANIDNNNDGKKKRKSKKIVVADIKEKKAKTSKQIEGGQNNEKDKKKKNDVPTIFFASRTHSQLSQVIAELKTCSDDYIADTSFKMSVLSSRTHTCIHKTVSKKKNVDEECKKLLNGTNCLHFQKVHALKNSLPNVWNNDQIKLLGKKTRGCPYYTSHAVMAEAQFVLCPYNYIIDRMIRNALKLNLKNAVVVIDEAHNIEDVARESASTKISIDSLEDILMQLRHLINICEETREAAEAMLIIVRGLHHWLKFTESNLKMTDYEREQNVISGEDTIVMFEQQCSLTPSTLPQIETYLSDLCFKEDEKQNNILSPSQKEIFDDNDSGKPRTAVGYQRNTLNNAASVTLSSLINVIHFMFQDNMKYVRDYRIVVLREKDSSYTNTKGYHNKNSRAVAAVSKQNQMKTTLNFWCMSGAAAFSSIDKDAHSIILTSGTLSPLDFFGTELGIDFPIRVEAGHVIDTKKQLWVGQTNVSNNFKLKATYENQDSIAFQDALGKMLCNYTTVIPAGMLAFLPSYGFLNKLHARWESTGLLKKLSLSKKVFVETKASNELDNMLKNYYKTIDKGNGALLLAVCRGKVSEGIDFANDYARGIVIIGLPFPSLKDTKILFKKKYQTDKQKVFSKSLNGEQWYKEQATRAVNQAFGRCIRHKEDYGAIILADERFRDGRLLKSLSKWIQRSVQFFDDTKNTIDPINTFFNTICPTLRQQRTLAGVSMPSMGQENKENIENNTTSGNYSTKKAIIKNENIKIADSKKRLSVKENERNRMMKKMKVDENHVTLTQGFFMQKRPPSPVPQSSLKIEKNSGMRNSEPSSHLIRLPTSSSSNFEIKQEKDHFLQGNQRHLIKPISGVAFTENDKKTDFDKGDGNHCKKINAMPTIYCLQCSEALCTLEHKFHSSNLNKNEICKTKYISKDQYRYFHRLILFENNSCNNYRSENTRENLEEIDEYFFSEFDFGENFKPLRMEDNANNCDRRLPLQLPLPAGNGSFSCFDDIDKIVYKPLFCHTCNPPRLIAVHLLLAEDITLSNKIWFVKSRITHDNPKEAFNVNKRNSLDQYLVDDENVHVDYTNCNHAEMSEWMAQKDVNNNNSNNNNNNISTTTTAMTSFDSSVFHDYENNYDDNEILLQLNLTNIDADD